MPLMLGRSGTEYVAMVAKLLSSNCGAHLVESYCKESNISETNWLRYLFSLYGCFEKGCPTKHYATMLKGIMGNGGLWYLIEALGVSATLRETSQTNLFMPSLLLLVNTVNLK